MFWIVSNGISAGLIILSEIMGQILSAFGMNGKLLSICVMILMPRDPT